MVSKTSIVTDFEIIEQYAKQNSLQFIKDKKGTRIEGNEKDTRHVLSRLASEFVELEFEEEELEKPQSRLDLSTYYRLKNIFELEDIEVVEDIVEEAKKRLGYMINEISYVNLITHLLILIKRMKLSYIYSDLEASQVFTVNTIDKTMAIAHYIADEISSAYEIEIPESEMKYIHQYLVCSGIQSDFLHLDLDNYALDIDKQCQNIVESLIGIVSDSVHQDLRQDKELKLSLVAHFVPLMQRLKYHVKIENPLVNEIKSQYSTMFSIVTLSLEMLEQKDLHHLNDDEIGFLTIHFQAAVERSMQQKRIIIVCPEGIGFSRLIAHRIERFISSVRIVDIVSLKKLSDFDISDIDFVISTTPIKKCDKPVILVSSFISEYDIRDINNYLIESHQNVEHPQLENLAQIVDKTVIFEQLEFKTKEQVLNYICDQMEQQGYVTSHYKQSVFDREKIMSTDLGNRIAIPHGSEQEIVESKIAIVTLKEPILWDKNEVEIVFLIAMTMKEPKKTKNVLKDLYAIMDSKNMVDKLVQLKTKEEILKLIRRS